MKFVHLLRNILRPGGRCWENWYKFYKRADEWTGRRTQNGEACDAIGAVTEFHNPSGWVVTP